jgi:hypothetical protein
MSQANSKPNFLFGTIGGGVGAVLGYAAFFWIARQGFYALILPPGLLGLFAGYFVGKRSIPFAIACGVAGLGLGLLTEWHFSMRKDDKGFLVFLAHVHQLNRIKLLMLAVGPVISYRLALGSDAKERASTSLKQDASS